MPVFVFVFVCEIGAGIDAPERVVLNSQSDKHAIDKSEYRTIEQIALVPLFFVVVVR